MKKTFKLVLIGILTSYSYLNINNVNKVSAFSDEDRMTNGLSFSDASITFDTKKSLSSIPKTFETIINLPETINERAGVIFGNYKNTSEACYNFEVQWINNKAIPKLYYDVDNVDTTNPDTVNIQFVDVDIRSSQFIHLVITHDTNFYGEEGSQYTIAKCYVNGELKQTIQQPVSNTIKNYYEGYDYIPSSTSRIGGDYRTYNPKQNFKGNIKSLELYSDVRTDAEVLSDYNRLLSSRPTDSNLLAGYNFTLEGRNYLKDYTGNYDLRSSLFINDEYNGLRFDSENKYIMDKKLEEMPSTLEAEIFLDKNHSGRGGVIVGNYGSNASLNFEISDNGKPRFFHKAKEDGLDKSIYFDTDVRTGDYAHLTIVHDDANKTMLCYLDGQLVESKNEYYEYFDSITDTNFVVGGDNRAGNAQYFKGVIKSITFYSDVRTSTEIYEDATNGVDLSTDNILFHYSFNDENNGKSIDDLSTNGYNLKYHQTWFSEKQEVKDYAYSFAAVGDTQIINWKTPEHMNTIYDWILDNQDSKNIQHVFGLGDITQSWGTQEQAKLEWQTAKNAISKMNGKISYSLVRGNHDNTKYLNDYFNYSAYTSQFSGFYEESNISNSYMELEIGDTKYLFMTLDYGASDDVLDWASEVVEDYDDYKVIVTTHAYMFRDGTTLDSNDVCPPETSSDIDFCVPVDSRPNRDYNNGEQLWDKFISQHGNIILVLSGHDPCDNVVTLQTEGIHGNIVTQMLIDPQGMDNDIGATGMVAMLYFNEDGSKMDVEFYSTVKEQYYKTSNQYSVDMSYAGYSSHYYETINDEKQHWDECICGLCTTKENHKWDNGKITKPSTYDSTGIRTYTCECGATKEEVIAKLSKPVDNVKQNNSSIGLIIGLSVGGITLVAGVIFIILKKKNK